MRDVYQILRKKETDLDRLRHEIDSLRIVAPMLADDEIEKELQAEPADEDGPGSEPRSTGTDGPMFSGANSESRFWGLMKRSR
ncbi:MAG: hypothetical protein ACM34E_07230 [Acidobacteriota bacterium]|jgi:hypothetical protein